jgi:hypothetical protein
MGDFFYLCDMKKLLILIVLLISSCGEEVEEKCTCNPKPQDGPMGEKFHYIDCNVNKKYKQ